MRVLFVEEDLGYINTLMGELSRDYVVDIAHTGEDGVYLSEVNDYDVIIVSDKLPDCTGIEMCCLTRTSKISSPIMLISEEFDHYKLLECLESGADICLPKRADPKQIHTGLDVLIRKSVSTKNLPIVIGDMSFDICSKVVSILGQEVKLRRKEYDILEYLVLRVGRIVSKEELLEHVWVKGIYVLSNTVEVHVTHLRNAIEKPFNIKFIETIKGFGYRLKVEKQAKNRYHKKDD